MLKKNPKVFEEMTLIAPSYRGLFGSDACPTPPTATATEIIPPSVAGQLLNYANPVAAIQSFLGVVDSSSSSPGKISHDSATGDTIMPNNTTSTTSATITTSPLKNETTNNNSNNNNSNDTSVKPVEITMVTRITFTLSYQFHTSLFITQSIVTSISSSLSYHLPSFIIP